jgi:hypothetical protein
MFGHLPSPILQVAHGALSGSRVHPYQPLEPVAQRCIFFRLYRDHEFENAAVLARRRGLFMLAGIQAYEITAKKCPIRRARSSPGVKKLCTGNASKDLAFCAARRHIVAVR